MKVEESDTIKRYSFYVQGMHCDACVTLIESELQEYPEVTRVKADLQSMRVEIEGEFGDKSSEHVARDLSEILKPHGYSFSVGKKEHSVKWGDFRLAIPIAIGFVFVFFLLQEFGIVNLVKSSEIGYGTAFLIGIIASLSTCMAVVGGLVLSMSANFARVGDKIRPQMMFHGGRLVSFFILGGVIGVVGSVFQLGVTGTFLISFLVGLVLLVLGLNLLDVFPWMKRLQPAMPKFIARRTHRLKDVNHTLTPFLVGVVTFFLPCGFTQSMQIYTLGSGDFLTGALTMFAFALGTLPVLALLSFTSVGIHTKQWSGVFFKTAGLVVIFFGIFNVINSLAAYGVIRPIF